MLDLAISPGTWLLPSKMVVNTESVVGYNNKLKKATSFMKIGVNSDLNIPVRRSVSKHNFGSGAVKLPHSGVERKYIEPLPVDASKNKAETKETRVVNSEKKRNKRSKRSEDCLHFARDQFECFDYCRGWVSLVSIQMKQNCW